MSNGVDDKGGTRVFKKSSPDGLITTYLGKRDFLDHQTHVDIIDGMVLVEKECLNRRVFAVLMAVFRYGREDLDVLGLQFRKDLLSLSTCVYPPDGEINCEESLSKNPKRTLTRLQERLKKKLGVHAYPFWFEIPANSPSSVTLQPASGDTGKPCGVDYELCTYVADDLNERPKKHSCVRLAIRKLTYAAIDKTKPQPSAELSKVFLMRSGLLHLEATLDKEMYSSLLYTKQTIEWGCILQRPNLIQKSMSGGSNDGELIILRYYHGESISVNVHVQNNSNKTVKKVKVSVVQMADICLFTTATYSCEVARMESSDGCPVDPGSTLSKVYTLCPLLSNNKDKRGLALDGKLKHEDTNLASSTILAPGVSTDNLGIVVQYKLKIRLVLSGTFSGEASVELPFTLTHPKPPLSPVFARRLTTSEMLANNVDRQQRRQLSSVVNSGSRCALDVDLIQLDTNANDGAHDDDIVFEDFARLRLKGVDGDDKDG